MDDYFERKLKAASTFLMRWQAGFAEMLELTASHKTLRLLVRGESRPGNLLIACIDPVSISGPVRWENCNLVIGVVEASKSQFFCVEDPGGGLKVICGDVEVKENVRLH